MAWKVSKWSALVCPSRVWFGNQNYLYPCLVNSCAAFAFVKFDNPESPARAVFEEVGHNFLILLDHRLNFYRFVAQPRL